MVLAPFWLLFVRTKSNRGAWGRVGPTRLASFGVPPNNGSGGASAALGRAGPAQMKAQLLICASTSRPWQYFSRRAGFSIFPVGLRGTLSKITRLGRL